MEKKEHLGAKWLRAIADGETNFERQDFGSGRWTKYSVADVLRSLSAGNAEFFRVKPRTITIGRYEVAEPMRDAPERNTNFWIASAGSVFCEEWYGREMDTEKLKAGVCWLKREDAELAAKAITELLTGAQ